MIPQEYLDNVEKEYRYYLWTNNEGNEKKGIVTYKSDPSKMTLSDIFGVVDNIVEGDYNSDSDPDYYDCLENIRDIDNEHWVSIVNNENDNELKRLKIAWMNIESEGNDKLGYGVDVFNFVCELTDVPFDENDSYVPDWNNDALYHVI